MPMMYMDAIAATIQIMQAPAEQIKIRSSYNLAAMSFTPTEIAVRSKNTYLNLRLAKPDFRQKLLTAGLLVLMTTKPEDWDGNMNLI
jgi:hypothetical protein